MKSGEFLPGDIIFFRSNGNPWDLLISMVSPEYVHVGVFIDGTRFIEASLFGNISVKTVDMSWDFDVFSFSGRPLNPTVFSKISAAVEVHSKDRYDLIGAIICGILRKIGLKKLSDNIDTNWWCSEFVAYFIFICFGTRLCPQLAFSDIMPDDIRNDPSVYFMEPVL